LLGLLLWVSVPLHLVCESGIGRRQPGGDVVADVFGLVLAELGSGVVAVDVQTHTHGAFGGPAGGCLVVEQTATVGLLTLEVVGELAQHGGRTRLPYPLLRFTGSGGRIITMANPDPSSDPMLDAIAIGTAAQSMLGMDAIQAQLDAAIEDHGGRVIIDLIVLCGRLLQIHMEATGVEPLAVLSRIAAEEIEVIGGEDESEGGSPPH